MTFFLCWSLVRRLPGLMNVFVLCVWLFYIIQCYTNAWFCVRCKSQNSRIDPSIGSKERQKKHHAQSNALTCMKRIDSAWLFLHSFFFQILIRKRYSTFFHSTFSLLLKKHRRNRCAFNWVCAYAFGMVSKCFGSMHSNTWKWKKKQNKMSCIEQILQMFDIQTRSPAMYL